MSTKIEDGGPAFPVGVEALLTRQGMSLRDWFAGQALAGILASPNFDEFALSAGTFWTDDEKRLRVAQAAFGYADAMLLAKAEVQP